MPLYSLGVLTTNVTSANATWEIRAGTKEYKLIEIGFFLNAATLTTIGLGVPAAIGVTPTTPVTFLNESDVNARATNVQSSLAWGTGPTVPTNFYRRIAFPANQGSGVIWQFPRGLAVASSSSLVLWNILGGAALQAYAIIEE
jgi:hypothetical protein